MLEIASGMGVVSTGARPVLVLIQKILNLKDKKKKNNYSELSEIKKMEFLFLYTITTKRSPSRRNAIELYWDTLWNNHNVEFCNNRRYFATLYTSCI
jgi:hypothetical protein